ncbi:MAG: hypothetical protein V4696_03850 [Pseudomonadota bacterium]
MLAFADPTARAMEDARRRNINAGQLAMRPIPFRDDLVPSRAAVEIKADGIGLLDVNGRLQSLQGVPFDAAEHLGPELMAIREAYGRPMMLQGEYIERGGFGATLAAFQSGVGEGAVVLWEAIPLTVWHGHELSQPDQDRRAMLEAVFANVRPRMVKLVDRYTIDRPDPIRIAECARIAFDADQEGIIVKDATAPYVRADSPFWLKVKDCQSVDVPIQSIRSEGGRMKSIIVTFQGKPNVVPTGFTEASRWALDEWRTGRMVEIKHLGRTAGGLLKGVSFLRFRDDKGAS